MGFITSIKPGSATLIIVAIQISFKALTNTNLAALVGMCHPPSAARLSQTSRTPEQTSAPYGVTGFIWYSTKNAGLGLINSQFIHRGSWFSTFLTFFGGNHGTKGQDFLLRRQQLFHHQKTDAYNNPKGVKSAGILSLWEEKAEAVISPKCLVHTAIMVPCSLCSRPRYLVVKSPKLWPASAATIRISYFRSERIWNTLRIFLRETALR